MTQGISKEIGSRLICPYCRSFLDHCDPIRACADCGTAHHERCWKEFRRCSVFGCTGKEARPSTVYWKFVPPGILILSLLNPILGIVLSPLLIPALVATVLLMVSAVRRFLNERRTELI